MEEKVLKLLKKDSSLNKDYLQCYYEVVSKCFTNPDRKKFVEYFVSDYNKGVTKIYSKQFLKDFGNFLLLISTDLNLKIINFIKKSLLYDESFDNYCIVSLLLPFASAKIFSQNNNKLDTISHGLTLGSSLNSFEKLTSKTQQDDAKNAIETAQTSVANELNQMMSSIDDDKKNELEKALKGSDLNAKVRAFLEVFALAFGKNETLISNLTTSTFIKNNVIDFNNIIRFAKIIYSLPNGAATEDLDLARQAIEASEQHETETLVFLRNYEILTKDQKKKFIDLLKKSDADIVFKSGEATFLLITSNLDNNVIKSILDNFVSKEVSKLNRLISALEKFKKPVDPAQIKVIIEFYSKLNDSLEVDFIAKLLELPELETKGEYYLELLKNNVPFKDISFIVSVVSEKEKKIKDAKTNSNEVKKQLDDLEKTVFFGDDYFSKAIDVITETAKAAVVEEKYAVKMDEFKDLTEQPEPPDTLSMTINGLDIKAKKNKKNFICGYKGEKEFGTGAWTETSKILKKMVDKKVIITHNGKNIKLGEDVSIFCSGKKKKLEEKVHPNCFEYVPVVKIEQEKQEVGNFYFEDDIDNEFIIKEDEHIDSAKGLIYKDDFVDFEGMIYARVPIKEKTKLLKENQKFPEPPKGLIEEHKNKKGVVILERLLPIPFFSAFNSEPETKNKLKQLCFDERFLYLLMPLYTEAACIVSYRASNNDAKKLILEREGAKDILDFSKKISLLKKQILGIKSSPLYTSIPSDLKKLENSFNQILTPDELNDAISKLKSAAQSLKTRRTEFHVKKTELEKLKASLVPTTTGGFTSEELQLIKELDEVGLDSQKKLTLLQLAMTHEELRNNLKLAATIFDGTQDGPKLIGDINTREQKIKVLLNLANKKFSVGMKQRSRKFEKKDLENIAGIISEDYNISDEDFVSKLDNDSRLQHLRNRQNYPEGAPELILLVQYLEKTFPNNKKFYDFFNSVYDAVSDNWKIINFEFTHDNGSTATNKTSLGILDQTINTSKKEIVKIKIGKLVLTQDEAKKYIGISKKASKYLQPVIPDDLWNLDFSSPLMLKTRLFEYIKQIYPFYFNLNKELGDELPDQFAKAGDPIKPPPDPESKPKPVSKPGAGIVNSNIDPSKPKPVSKPGAGIVNSNIDPSKPAESQSVATETEPPKDDSKSVTSSDKNTETVLPESESVPNTGEEDVHNDSESGNNKKPVAPFVAGAIITGGISLPLFILAALNPALFIVLITTGAVLSATSLGMAGGAIANTVSNKDASAETGKSNSIEGEDERTKSGSDTTIQAAMQKAHTPGVLEELEEVHKNELENGPSM